jgi:carboxypeptidase Taq
VSTATAWQTFERRMQELEDIGSMASLAAWDEQTYCAAKGREARGQVLATLAAIRHERVVDDAYGDALEELSDDGGTLSDEQRAMVRVAKHLHDREARLPAELVRELAEQASRTFRAWLDGRQSRDFARYAPELERMLRLKVQEADALAFETRYDALLDEYEPGMRVRRLEPLLHGLRDELVPFVHEVLGKPAPDRSFLDGPYEREAQLALTRRIVAEVGFDFEAGRQDLSAHPFCSSPSKRDVRLTTRVYDSLEPGALFSSLHEMGHGLYEQGLVGRERTAIGRAPSLGLHESQSRFWENQIGRSSAFWQHFLPVAQEAFPAQLGSVGVDAFLRAVNRVEAGAIRVDADELTYNLHILLRFELERALIDEHLAVADLPAAWRAKMEAYLGYTPRDDVEGVMQDIHWSSGGLGYFPTYTLGNLYAAAIGERMREDLEVDEHVGRGDFGPILGWLRERVHAQGFLLPAEDLMRQVTGQQLGHAPFMRYVRAKFGELYGVG